ncbi:radical SAM/SPASM domain-containing protein (plasmid) [Bacillus cereus]|uniref:radical SAM/SPASM domain-containing protein n=1 Tax=Bacillus cereus TaxID=1396 RepID=UPI003F685F6F
MRISKQVVTSKYLVFFKNIGCEDLILQNLLTTKNFDLQKININLLRECLNPTDLDILKGKYGEKIVDDYIAEKLLLDQELVWEQLNIKQVQIEINSDCNLKCRFCPVSLEPKPKRVMSMEIFQEIIKKVSTIKTLENVTFSSFNEPLFDPYFKERIEILSSKGIKLRLMTNASYLLDEHVNLLKKSKVIDFIKINLPSVDKHEYIRLTGSDSLTYQKVIHNINKLISTGLEIRIAVNGTKKEIQNNIKEICETFHQIPIDKIISQNTLDRAGSIKNEYHQNVNIEGQLSGWCFLLLTWLVFTVKGDIVLCANDYYEKHIYGNILDGEITDILNSERAKNIRKQVYGEMNAGNDFICRNCIYMKRGALFRRFNPLINKV